MAERELVDPAGGRSRCAMGRRGAAGEVEAERLAEGLGSPSRRAEEDEEEAQGRRVEKDGRCCAR